MVPQRFSKQMGDPQQRFMPVFILRQYPHAHCYIPPHELQQTWQRTSDSARIVNETDASPDSPYSPPPSFHKLVNCPVIDFAYSLELPRYTFYRMAGFGCGVISGRPPRSVYVAKCTWLGCGVVFPRIRVWWGLTKTRCIVVCHEDARENRKWYLKTASRNISRIPINEYQLRYRQDGELYQHFQ